MIMLLVNLDIVIVKSIKVKPFIILYNYYFEQENPMSFNNPLLFT